MYLRYILPRKDPDSGVEAGIFTAAHALAGRGEISASVRQELADLLAWFEAEITTPERFDTTKLKGTLWVKDTALEHVTRLQRLAQILRDHGHHVAMIRNTHPGYVVYQDDHQIIAEPFQDLEPA